MKIYQLQYTRLGKQGSNAGWQVTGGTKGTPQLVVNTFYKLASNLVAVGNSVSMPGEALDIQIVEHYAYISHINYSSKNIGDDTDARGVSFVHGYILRAEDYQELVKEPAHVAGMEDSCFERNYEGKKMLPLAEELPFISMETEEIINSLGMTKEQVQQLLLCVYAALNSVNGSLCIRSARIEKEQFKNLCRAVTYLIYESLPYVLRLKLSVFSYYRPGATICFSNGEDGSENYYDLDTGKYQCPQIPGYEFISHCIDLRSSEDDRKNLYEMIQKFTDLTYGGNYEVLKPQHIELAYQAIRCNAAPEELDDFTTDAFCLIKKAANYDMLDPYYAYLVKQYLLEQRDLPGAEVFKRLQRRYVETKNKDLKAAFNQYFAERLCTCGNGKAYEMLYQIQFGSQADYAQIEEYLEEHRPEFLLEYRLNYYLERSLDCADKVKKYFQDNSGKLPAAEAEKLNGIIEKLFSKDIQQLKTNQERYQLCLAYKAFLDHLEAGGYKAAEATWEKMQAKYWEDFSMDQFSYEEKEAYRQMDTEKKRQVMPEAVLKLINAEQELFSNQDPKNFCHVFWSDAVVEKEEKRKELRDQLKKEAADKNIQILDVWLLLNYDPKNGFDLKKLADDLKQVKLADLMDDPYKAGGFDESVLLSKESFWESFMQDLKEEAASKKKKTSYEWEKIHEYYFPKMDSENREFCMYDYIQKCMLFAAVLPLSAVGFSYCRSFSELYGYAALGGGILLCLAGFMLNLFAGESDTAAFFCENMAAAVVTILLTVLAGALLVMGMIFALSGAGILFVVLVIAAEVLLLTGRLFLLYVSVY